MGRALSEEPVLPLSALEYGLGMKEYVNEVEEKHGQLLAQFPGRLGEEICETNPKT